MTVTGLNFVILGIILQSYKVVPMQLILHPVGRGEEKLVVIDMDEGRTFCYPSLEEMVNLGHEHLPTRHRDFGLDPLHELTQLRNNARVICKGVRGYTHLERVYPVPAPDDVPNSNKRVKWVAECVGYEPLLSHCFTFNVSNEDSHCENLLGIECGYCSKKLKLNIGESKVLTSPEYPQYSDDVICEWTIDTPTPSVIEVSFSDFELPPRNERGHCHRGLLEIEMMRKDADGESSFMAINTICGSALPDPVSFSANGAVIRFSSGLFIPRPIGEDAGFNLTVAIVEAAQPIWLQAEAHGQLVVTQPTGALGGADGQTTASPEEAALLDFGEIMAIVLGGLLVMFICFFVYYVFRRYKRDRQNSVQRRLMQERVATQRQGRHDAALTAMLAASLHSRSAGPGHSSPSAPKFTGDDQQPYRRDHDVSQKDNSVVRTPSAQSRNAYDSRAGPPMPHTAAPPPPPPPPPKPYKERFPGVSFPNTLDHHDSYEEPIYMEATKLEKSFSYIQLDDIKFNNSPSERHYPVRVPRPTVSNMMMPYTLSNALTSTTMIRNFPNNLDLGSPRSPYQRDSPRKVSSSAQNMTSNSLNVWPSTSSLTPSNKTVPLTPSRKKCLNFNFALNSWNKSSGADSPTSSGTVSPFPGHTPNPSPRTSNISQCSTLMHGTCNGFHHSNTTLSDSGNTPFSPRKMPHEKSPHHLAAWTPFHGSPICKRADPDVSFSSCESVFTSGDNINQARSRDRNKTDCMCKQCLLFKQQMNLASIISPPQGHLSKSCGDVSPAAPLPQRDAILDDMHQSAPTLPGDQSGAGFMRPALRRVSEMFMGSGTLYPPGSENNKKPDPKNFLESSNVCQDSKILDKKMDGKGMGSRKLSSKTTSEASLKKERVSLSSSPRRPTASSVSSASFLNYKYNRLEKISNADRDALLPRSNSRETSDGSNSPDKKNEPV